MTSRTLLTALLCLLAAALLAVSIVAALLAALTAVCDVPAGELTKPIAPLVAPSPIAVSAPVHNYTVGSRRHQHGSCLHAAVQDLLRWQGLEKQADYWRSHFGGPAMLPDIVAIADQLRLHHIETDAGDESFLEYVTTHRLGAAIYWQVDEPHDHAIVFCGFAGSESVLLGVNRPVTSRMPKTEFLRRWHRCGGVAFTILPWSNP